ncbi:deoxyribodipyrimidine photo-lyase, partial [candidate division GN15 bacterium]
MPLRHKQALFIFRRDLRLDDNTGLLAALESSRVVIPVFIFDPRQAGTANPFRGNFSMQFMADSLADLSDQLARKGATLHL